jgi:hypothetical protein
MVSPVPVNPFASELWIDQPDAEQRIEAMAQAGTISPEERSTLDDFRRDGFARIALDPSHEPLDELVADLDCIWSEKPADLVYGYGKPFLRRMSAADTARERQPGYRIHELQSHSAAARHFYLHPRLHALATLILGERPVAIQSILFEYGSAQALHRDPVFVRTARAGHLFAAWIALEDIHPDAGPLMYVPRSHRLPPYEYRPGVYRFDSTSFGQAEIDAEQQWLREQMHVHALHTEHFTPRKGEVLFWHAGLYHGGAAIADASRTRRSYVIHYSSMRTHHSTAIMFRDSSDESQPMQIRGTLRLMKKGRALGFANPISRRAYSRWASLRHRIASRFRR